MCNKSTGHESQIGTESGFDWREGEGEEEEEEAILQKRREISPTLSSPALFRRALDAAKAKRSIGVSTRNNFRLRGDVLNVTTVTTPSRRAS